MQEQPDLFEVPPTRQAWNKGKIMGAKPPLRPKHVWSIRTKLQVEGRKRDLALFNLAIDSKLRGCDVISIKVDDIAPRGHAVERATIRHGPKGTDGKRTARLYSQSYAHHLVQSIRKDAGLPSYFTLEACRHGGMTELGDAELTEQEIMTLSTHATPEAARISVKRNERQELSAASKRRDFVEGKRTKRG